MRKTLSILLIAAAAVVLPLVTAPTASANRLSSDGVNWYR
jgi:hypothetical protein